MRMSPPPIPLRNEDATGLKSLSRRLTEMEKNLEEDSNMNFLNRLKRIEKDNKKQQLEALYNSYAGSLTESDISVDSDNFVDIVIHTIKYVNQNIANICKLAQAKQSIDFEKICIANFVLDFKINEWTEAMITKGVEALYFIILSAQIGKVEATSSELVKASKSKSKLGKFLS